MEAGTSTPFAILSVQGFEDSPVSWGTKEHGYATSGENGYTFIVLPGQEYWYYLALGPNDAYQ